MICTVEHDFQSGIAEITSSRTIVSDMVGPQAADAVPACKNLGIIQN